LHLGLQKSWSKTTNIDKSQGFWKGQKGKNPTNKGLSVKPTPS
jgi:hypothetical protein